MSCNKPLYRISEEFLNSSDLPYSRNGGLLIGQSELDRYLKKYPRECIISVPCGQCMGCRVAKSQEWALRCSHESSLYSDNLFITLTYNPESLSQKECVDFVTGEFSVHNVLVPDDLKKFMKDLREYYRSYHSHVNIRFFASGEYGDIGDLPHFHLILFNCPPLPDFLRMYDSLGHLHFCSDTFEHRLWKKGFVDIQPLCFESICYVSRYVTKKLIGKPMQEAKALIKASIPVRCLPFVRMSRMPGIGGDYAKSHFEDIYPYDAVVFNKRYAAFFAKPPRYYDKLFEEVNPDEMEIVRGTRSESAAISESNLLRQLDLSGQLGHRPIEAYFDLKESILSDKIKNSSCKL